MTQAIFTKVLAATDSRGQRIKAWTKGNVNTSITLAWDYSVDHYPNHVRALKALVAKVKEPGHYVHGYIGAHESVWVSAESVSGTKEHREVAA